jgi:alginate O-acetyltransferase complex protein AlgI
MSFTSLTFIFVFLPLAYLAFVLAHRFGGAKQAINALAAISLVFYALFGTQLLLILLISMVFNFAVGNVISCLGEQPKIAKNLMLGSIVANLGLLGYLKYTNFFIDVTNQVAGTGYSHFDIAVPLGVSFFTFVQIGYLIDAVNGQLVKHDFARYIVFTAFFPCVTAGPLVMQLLTYGVSLSGLPCLQWACSRKSSWLIQLRHLLTAFLPVRTVMLRFQLQRRGSVR